jgi:ATP/maltotriose-dependent transcriptional regulator MalT
LDDLHLVYDTSWLAQFFAGLIPILPREVHLLICARSLPPGTLWRVRSKQVLTVVDENALAFTLDEARELCGESTSAMEDLIKASRGRASLVTELAARPRSDRNALTQSTLALT